MSAREVEEAIESARAVWAEAMVVLEQAGDLDLVDELRRLVAELPAVTPASDVLTWSAPLNRVTRRVGELAGHELAVRVQWTFLDVLIVQGGGVPARFKR